MSVVTLLDILLKFMQKIPLEGFKNGDKKQIAKYITIALFSMKALQKVIGKANKSRIQKRWRDIAQAKYRFLQGKISSFQSKFLCQFQLSAEDKQLILNSNIAQLKEFLYHEKFTCENILMTFIQRSIEYGIKLNLISDVLFEEALQQAIQQDEMINSNKEVIYKPGNELFGIPVSFKDCFIVKGVDCTYGCAARCFKPYHYDGYQSEAIKRAGGLIFVKTSMPQIGMTVETNNFITGRALNPYNQERSAGGSTGGEGGLLAVKGSVVGMGNDVGGSIRIPSAFCGLYGYKPSTVRVCLTGAGNLPLSMQGNKNLVITNGPMGRSVDDLVSTMQVLLNQDRYFDLPQNIIDPYYLPVRFSMNRYKEKSKLKIGYLLGFDTLPACQANQRGVQMAVEALKKQGHEVVPFEIDQEIYKEAMEMCMHIMLGDSKLEGYNELIQGEEMIPEYSQNQLASSLPKLVVRTLRQIFKVLELKRLQLMINAFCQQQSAYDYLKLSGKQQELRNKMLDEWNKVGLDGLITPVSASVALKHGTIQDCLMTIIYCFVWNLFDYNAGVVPVTKVQEDEQSYQDDRGRFGKKCKLVKTLDMVMQGSKGMPVAVQVITKPFEDEQCLRIMKQLQDSIKFQIDP